MSQNDYTIANQTTPLFRADLNNALQALASNSSGATAPATTYANMMWYDTSTSVLKMRSEADDAWIDLGTLDQGTNKFTPEGATPTGLVSWYASDTAPDGWLKANGAAISRTVYADLFAAIGTTFGTGDGSTTFNIPDLRGEFIRGWDDARGIDSGRAFGSAQADDFESHSHSLWAQTGGANAYQYDTPPVYPSNGVSGSKSSIAGWQSSLILSSGGSETRPRNVALLACIKF